MIDTSQNMDTWIETPLMGEHTFHKSPVLTNKIAESAALSRAAGWYGLRT